MFKSGTGSGGELHFSDLAMPRAIVRAKLMPTRVGDVLILSPKKQSYTSYAVGLVMRAASRDLRASCRCRTDGRPERESGLSA
jgi:hypothetical protein